MPEVASASVSLLPTFAGGAKEIERVLGPSLGRAGAAGGEQFGSSFAASLTRSLGPLAATGGVAGVLFAGWDRLTAIDTAQAKLTAFGYTYEQVTDVMKSATEAVLGTQFSLADSATQAAAALGAGVKQGKDLTRYLTLVADTAAATSSSLGDIGLVMGQIQAATRVYTQDANQLATRGLPVWKLIGDAFDTTAAGARKLVEQGKVDAETFFTALDGYIGGTAKNMDSFSANLSNLQASLGRIGANLLGGDLDQPKNAVKELTETLKAAEPAAAVVGNALTGVLSVVNSIPAPMLAAAAASMILARRTREMSFTSMAAGARSAVDSFRLLRTEAMFAGASMPGVTAGLAGVSSAARSAGGAMLSAFGGPVGLAITGVGAALSILIPLWQEGEQAAAAQKSAVDALTSSFDTNTGAMTDNTIAQLNEQLKDTLPLLDAIGVDYTGMVTAMAQGDPDGKVAAIRSELEGIIEAQKQSKSLGGLDQAVNADAALKSINEVGDALELAQERWERALDATGNSVDELAPKFNSVKEAIDGAFSGLSGLADQTSAVQALAQSILDNGNAIDTTTSGGIANLTALQATIQAMADNAGDNYDVFVTNVSGLMQYLDKQGVNTQNVMGAVRAAVENVAGKKYAMFLDGSQYIAEAQRIIAASRAAIAAAAATKNYKNMFTAVGAIAAAGVTIGRFNALVNQAASATKYIGSTFKGVKSAAAGSVKPVKASGSAISAAGKSAKATAAELRDLRSELYATAQAWLAPSRYSNDAQSLIDQINDAYASGAVGSKANREALKKEIRARDLDMQKIATNREKLADRIDTASQALADAVALRDDYREQIIQGVRALADVTKYTAAGNDTVAALREQYRGLADLSKYSSTAAAAVTGLRDQYRALADLSKYTAARSTVAEIRAQYAALGALSKFAGEVEQTVTSTYTKGGRQYAVQQVITQQKNAATMIQGLKDQVAAATSFKANVDKLRKLGLNQTSLDQLMAEFLSSGDGSVVAELVKGGKTAVSQVNQLTTQLANLGGKTQTAAQEQTAVRKAMTDGLRQQVAQAKSFKTAYDQVKKLGLNETSLSNLMADFMSSGDASQIRALAAGGKSAVGEVNSLMSQLGNLGGKTQSVAQQQEDARRAIYAGLEEQVKQAKSFKTAYDKLAKLKLNETSLANLMQDFMATGDASQAVALAALEGSGAVNRVNTLMGQLSALGGKSKTLAQEQAEARKAVTDGLRDQLSQVKYFKSAYDQLRKSGLNDTSLQNLMQDFLSSGDAAQIRAIAAGGTSTVKEINKLMADISKVTGTAKSGNWASAVADDMYKAGIDTAQGFLKGLQSQDSVLGKQYAKMADDLLKTVKKKLGIASPSKEMAKLAGFTSDGWNQNLHLDPITPDVAIPAAGASSGTGGFAGEVWLMVDGEPVRAVVSRQLAGAGAAKVAALRGGRRS